MIIGIDLGTTNSLVSVWQDGQAKIIPNVLGNPLTPSVVGLDEDGNVLVGQAAWDRLVSHPSLTTSVFKRYMGTNREVNLGKRKFRPEELSALVLRALKADAEAWLKEPVTEAVISVPAYFNDTQRKATRAAGELAGLKVERLINEPTAAALAYGLQQREDENTFLVFDLGGGTFDVSVLEMFEGVMEVRASAGDNFLGGEDFDQILVEGFLENAGSKAGITPDAMTDKTRQLLKNQGLQAKLALTRGNAGEMKLGWEGKEVSWRVDEDAFAKLAAPLMSRLRTPVERALRDARIRESELSQIVLVGGATRMPLVRSLVARMFGRMPMLELDPDQVVAMGAAVQAALKSRDAALEDVVLTDVCPYTLGTEIVQEFGKGQYKDGYFLPIIERNTVIPTSRVDRVYTVEDGQRKVEVSVYQGESRLIKNNILLGKLDLALPSKPKGEEAIDIRFTYDINGLLEVETTVVSNGSTRAQVFQDNPGTLSQKEIEARFKALASLKVHPRDQMENMALLSRAERLYEEYLGEQREALAAYVAAYEQALDKQEPTDIKLRAEHLKEVLDQLEGDRYL